jgi:hypothetical protein
MVPPCKNNHYYGRNYCDILLHDAYISGITAYFVRFNIGSIKTALNLKYALENLFQS